MEGNVAQMILEWIRTDPSRTPDRDEYQREWPGAGTERPSGVLATLWRCLGPSDRYVIDDGSFFLLYFSFNLGVFRVPFGLRLVFVFALGCHGSFFDLSLLFFFFLNPTASKLIFALVLISFPLRPIFLHDSF